MSLPTHLIFKYFKDVMVVMAYQVLLDLLVHLEEMVPMERKETEKNQNLLDQEMGVWSLLDGDAPPVLQLMIQKYSTKGKQQGVIIGNMEVELTTFVYLMNLSFSLIHLVYLMSSPTSMELNIKLIKTVVSLLHFMITMSHVLYVMFPLEYPI